jgi:perosamine synthetase
MIPVNTPLLNGNEKKYLNECIDTGWISSEGPFVKEFEEKFSKKMGRNYGVAVSNGSVAIDAAIVALGIGPGDEVILPDFTIISCAAAVVRAGAKPVVVDCDPSTWNMDVEKIEQVITSKTKAIMLVHIYGLPTDVDPVLDIAKKYNLKVIEDAAEAHGLLYKGKPCGSFGDISTFSFYPNKHVTTGEGGMILTNNEELAERCRSLRNLCFRPEKRFVHEELGWNFRMTNLQAALGIAQLERLDEFIIKKKRMGAYYTKELSGLTSKIQLPLNKTAYAENVYWVFGVILKPEAKIDATEIMKRLGRLGVGTRPFFWPMHEQPVLQNMGFFREQKCPESSKLGRMGFYIPSGLGLTDNEMEEVVSKVKEVLR